jgi:imidazole glycerol-phosphate synthase subunit HisH
MHIAIVDYGMGNLRSVSQALHHVAPDCKISIANDAQEILRSDRVVLPGQGAMPDCMAQLRSSGLLDAVLYHLRARNLFLEFVWASRCCLKKAKSVSQGWRLTPLA